ncbi:MAG: PAS domain S-box protein [Anaerolineales bacterium]|nr:PAS domain S-box protein [Anaerolineales bacterium]
MLDGATLPAELQPRTPVELTSELILKRAVAGDLDETSLKVALKSLAEEAVKLAEQRYRRLFEGAPVMYITTLNQDGHGLVSDCNQLFLSSLGYTRAEVIGQPLEKFYSPTSRCKLLAGYPLALKGKLGTEERELLCSDGRIIPTLFEAVPEVDADGRVIGTQASFVDITERKRVEMALSESSEKFTQIAENIQEVFWMFDNVQQRLIYLSPAYEEIWGQLAEDTYRDARVYIDALYPDDRSIMFSALARQANGERTEMEYRIVRPDGAIRWIHDRSFPILDANGAVVRTTGIAADVTERKQAEIALRLSEEKYRGLMESLDSVIALVDYDGRFVYMNDVAAAQMGGAVADLTGKTMAELFPEPVASVQLEHVRKTIDADTSAVYEAQSRIRGMPRWYRTSLQPIHDEHGNVAFALIYSTDIHDLKTAQHELLELNRTLEERVEERTVQVQDLYENAPTGYHTLDVSGNFVQINQTELNWFGYARGEVIGRPFSDLVTHADQRQFAMDFAVLMQNGWVRDLEYELRRKDGSTFSALIRASAVFDAEQKPVASRFTVFDNTERKQAEIALRESEEQNRLLFEESPDASVLVDDAGCIVKANRAYASLTKYSLDELIGATAGELGLVAENTSNAMRTEVIQAMVRGDSFVTMEHPLRCADGSIVTVESRIFLLQLRGVTHTLVTSRDISTRKQAEAALRIANAEIERAMRLKDEFLANVSHELRTPLSGVLALSETLQEQVYGPLNARQIASLRNIELSGRHLLSLINDLLDLSKIEAGKLELSLESVSVDDVCQASLVFVKEIASKKQIKLIYDSPDPELHLLTDARRQDTGIGIAANSLPQLFQPFSQLDSALARQFEGTGLGLALVKRLAMQHGGDVRVESAGIVGEGSTFTLVLPYTDTPGNATTHSTATQDSEPPRRPASARVLLTEDNEVTIEALTGYLEYLGYQVAVARTGPEALELAHRFVPDLIVMDIHLPQMDGLEVTRRLRRDARFANTPIIAVTALAMSNDRERCLAAGANEYLSKPVRVSELAVTISRLLDPKFA